MSESVTIDYFTDVLCIWAWIAQRRTDELESAWGDRINVCYRQVDVFGDTRTRIGEGWADRGGFAGFRDHVVESAAPYPEIEVNPDVWIKVQPRSSANAHLVLSATLELAGREAARQLAAGIRHAFFVDARDIGDFGVLGEIAADFGLDPEAIRMAVEDGRAAAGLMRDYQQARKDNITGSPSWVLNEGRQKLYGNVGFHVLNANVEGLFTKHASDASWC